MDRTGGCFWECRQERKRVEPTTATTKPSPLLSLLQSHALPHFHLYPGPDLVSDRWDRPPEIDSIMIIKEGWERESASCLGCCFLFVLWGPMPLKFPSLCSLLRYSRSVQIGSLFLALRTGWWSMQPLESSSSWSWGCLGQEGEWEGKEERHKGIWYCHWNLSLARANERI